MIKCLNIGDENHTKEEYDGWERQELTVTLHGDVQTANCCLVQRQICVGYV